MHIYKYTRKTQNNAYLGKFAYSIEKGNYRSIGYEFMCTVPEIDLFSIERKLKELNDIYFSYHYVHKHL